MQNKEYYFISGLPRSGSTLLSGILKQNPEFYAGINSPVCEIIDSTMTAITNSGNDMGINEERRKDLYTSIFNGYYSFTNRNIIFDTARKWTACTPLIKRLFPYTKIICCVRDIGWVLDSFEKIISKNSFHTCNIIPREESTNVFSRCDKLMDTLGGNVAVPLSWMQQGYSINPNMIKFVEYEDLCKYPEKTMKSIYDFIDKPYYDHDFNNVEYSSEIIDSFYNLKDLHTVRKRVEWTERKTILPPSIWKKYSNMEFWRSNYKNIPFNYN